MILIADSGATSTSWILQDDHQKIYTSRTAGLSLLYTNETKVQELIRAEVFADTLTYHEHMRIYFYGAGCELPHTQQRMQKILAEIFPHADIHINGDMLGACRATSKKERGVVCILGTGSASALYDGEKIIDQIPSLGFFLGDEGSGANLGRLLIQALAYRNLSEEIRKECEKFFGLSVPELVEQIYASKTPSKLVGGFAMFCIKNRKSEDIKKLVEKNFDDFIMAHIHKYPESKHLPIHALGSIAFYLEKELQATLHRHHLTLGKVLQDPIQELLHFHSSQ